MLLVSFAADIFFAALFYAKMSQSNYKKKRVLWTNEQIVMLLEHVSASHDLHLV